MMPAIRISDENYEWLKSQAVPFEDTPDRVLTRLRQRLEVSPLPVQSSPGKQTPTNGIRLLDPMNPGDLTFAIPMKVQVGAINVSEREWKAIVIAIHRIAAERFKTFEEVRAATIARIVEGSLDKGGYNPVPGTKISVQGMDANASWRSTLHLASQLKTPVEVTVMWRNTPKAAYPGETAQLSWIPS